MLAPEKDIETRATYQTLPWVSTFSEPMREAKNSRVSGALGQTRDNGGEDEGIDRFGDVGLVTG